MGRTWCRTDPVVEIDGTPYQLTIGIDGDARGNLSAVHVAIYRPGGAVEFRGQHGLLGVPIQTHTWAMPDTGADLIVETKDGTPYACTLSLVPRGNPATVPIPELFGMGLSGTYVIAVPVVADGDAEDDEGHDRMTNEGGPCVPSGAS